MIEIAPVNQKYRAKTIAFLIWFINTENHIGKHENLLFIAILMSAGDRHGLWKYTV